MEVSLNDVFVTRSYSNYAYKAYIQNLLTYSNDVKNKGFLRCEGWSSDIAEHFESLPSSGGLKTRRGWIKGKKLELAGALKVDLFRQYKLLPSQIDLKLKCVRSDNNFVIVDCFTPAANDVNKGAYKVVIEKAVFKVKKVQLTPSEDFRLIKEIQQAPFQIPVRRSDVIAHTIPPGVRNITIDRLAESSLPRTVLVGLVNSHGYNGEQNKNPFKFDTFNISGIAMFLNGRMIPSRPYTPDFEEKSYNDSYIALCNTVGAWRSDHAPLSYDDYMYGNCIFHFLSNPKQIRGVIS